MFWRILGIFSESHIKIIRGTHVRLNTATSQQRRYAPLLTSQTYNCKNGVTSGHQLSKRALYNTKNIRQHNKKNNVYCCIYKWFKIFLCSLQHNSFEVSLTESTHKQMWRRTCHGIFRNIQYRASPRQGNNFGACHTLKLVGVFQNIALYVSDILQNYIVIASMEFVEGKQTETINKRTKAPRTAAWFAWLCAVTQHTL